MLWWARKTREASLLAVNPTASATRDIKLGKPECSVGSEKSNDLVIPDGSVSRQHALIRLHRGRWQVIDCESTNGTFVGDRKATEWISLRDGQEVRFGGAQFIFRSSKAPGVRTTSGLPVRRRGSMLRAIIVLVAVGLVIGFAVTQYFIYRSYQRQEALSHNAPPPKP
jgi:pSer/pThr/pTyr-binding forkhead associated (FHA) protein